MSGLIPAWDALHPAVIHFPIALLLVAPLFLVIGALLRPDRGRLFALAALMLMVVGTGGAWLAVATGEANAEIVEHNSALKATLDQHEDLAGWTRNVFTVLTLIYAIIVILMFMMHEPRKLVTMVLPLVFVVIYAGGAYLLATTAHQGGRLVHELGSSSSTTTAVATPAGDD